MTEWILFAVWLLGIPVAVYVLGILDAHIGEDNSLVAMTAPMWPLLAVFALIAWPMAKLYHRGRYRGMKS
jgi:hypothetical protein